MCWPKVPCPVLFWFDRSMSSVWPALVSSVSRDCTAAQGERRVQYLCLWSVSYLTMVLPHPLCVHNIRDQALYCGYPLILYHLNTFFCWIYFPLYQVIHTKQIQPSIKASDENYKTKQFCTQCHTL